MLILSKKSVIIIEIGIILFAAAGCVAAFAQAAILKESLL